MNKAFVREPEDDGRAFCPRCGTLGVPVNSGPLDTHIRPESRAKMLDAAWFCGFYRCDVAYFNLFGGVVLADELKGPVYPYDANAPICVCFGSQVRRCRGGRGGGHADADSRGRSRERKPGRHSVTCSAADGQSCMGALQELYMRLKRGGRVIRDGLDGAEFLRSFSRAGGLEAIVVAAAWPRPLKRD